MLEAVQYFSEFKYHLLVCFSFYIFKHLNVDKLINKSIEKSCFDVYLVNVEVKKSRYCKEDFEGYRLYYSSKSLIEVNFKLLEVGFYYLLSFKVSNITICITFQFVYPLFSQ